MCAVLQSISQTPVGVFLMADSSSNPFLQITEHCLSTPSMLSTESVTILKTCHESPRGQLTVSKQRSGGQCWPVHLTHDLISG